MLRQELQRGADGNTEMRGELLNVLVSQRRFDLVRRDREVGATAQPRIHLGAEAILLQVVD